MPEAKLLTGLVAAAHSPFHSDGSLNLAAVESQASHLAANGITTVFICGTTGESHSLTTGERMQLARQWLAVAHGALLKVVVHVGSNSLVEARALAANAEEFGAAAVSALAPSYFRPRDLDALIDCCAEIASAAPNTPFYFYDIPGFTGVSFSMPDFLEQAPERIPNLAGIKFTNSDLMAYQLCLRAGGGRFDVPYGSDEWLLAALALGARGAVGSTYNFAAPVYHRLMARFEAGALEAARTEQFRSVQIVRALARRGFMASAKALMSMLGVDVGPPRLPHVSLTPAEVSGLRGELEQLGFFEWITGNGGN